MNRTSIRRLGTWAAVFAGTLLGAAALSQTTAPAKQSPLKKPLPGAAVNTPQNTSGVLRINCLGPLKFSFKRVPERARPMVYDFMVEFKGAATANLKPGECWREGGWNSGGSLSTQRDGQLIYRVDLGVCPFLETLTMEKGRITDYKANDAFAGGEWFEYAVRGEGGRFMVEALWLGPPQHSHLPAAYAVQVPAGARTRGSGCG